MNIAASEVAADGGKSCALRVWVKRCEPAVREREDRAVTSLEHRHRLVARDKSFCRQGLPSSSAPPCDVEGVSGSIVARTIVDSAAELKKKLATLDKKIETKLGGERSAAE